MSNKIVKGRYSFTREEQNFIYNVISQISQEDKDFKIFKVFFKDIQDLEKTIKHYKRFVGFAEKLLQKIVRIRDENNKKTIVCSWFSHISHKDGNSYIECSFDPLLKPYLIQLKEEFVQVKLPLLLSFKSKYTSRLYLLLKSNYDRQYTHKKNLLVTYDIDYLIVRFEMPNTYKKRYSHFKESFLDKVIEEINYKTNLQISYTELKTGRKITSIQFCISKPVQALDKVFDCQQETKLKTNYISQNLSNKAREVLLDEELDLTISDLKKIFEHYCIEDIEEICEELWSIWDNKKLMSHQAFFRGKLKYLNKKKTENQNIFFGFDELFDTKDK